MDFEDSQKKCSLRYWVCFEECQGCSICLKIAQLHSFTGEMISCVKASGNTLEKEFLFCFVLYLAGILLLDPFSS